MKKRRGEERREQEKNRTRRARNNNNLMTSVHVPARHLEPRHFEALVECAKTSSAHTCAEFECPRKDVGVEGRRQVRAHHEVSDEMLAHLEADALLPVAERAWSRTKFIDTYYDTRGLDLARRHCWLMCRLRIENGKREEEWRLKAQTSSSTEGVVEWHGMSGLDDVIAAMRSSLDLPADKPVHPEDYFTLEVLEFTTVRFFQHASLSTHAWIDICGVVGDGDARTTAVATVDDEQSADKLLWTRVPFSATGLRPSKTRSLLAAVDKETFECMWKGSRDRESSAAHVVSLSDEDGSDARALHARHDNVMCLLEDIAAFYDATLRSDSDGDDSYDSEVSNRK